MAPPRTSRDASLELVDYRRPRFSDPGHALYMRYVAPPVWLLHRYAVLISPVPAPALITTHLDFGERALRRPVRPPRIQVEGNYNDCDL